MLDRPLRSWGTGRRSVRKPSGAFLGAAVRFVLGCLWASALGVTLNSPCGKMTSASCLPSSSRAPQSLPLALLSTEVLCIEPPPSTCHVEACAMTGFAPTSHTGWNCPMVPGDLLGRQAGERNRFWRAAHVVRYSPSPEGFGARNCLG